MAIKPKKANIPTEIYFNLAVKFAPLWAPSFVAFLFLVFLIFPSMSNVFKTARLIDEKKNFINMAERSTADVANMTKDLEVLKKKVVEFESRLPARLKTNLIIETLQEITKKSKLKFSSLEPLAIKKHTLPETKDTFVELPVKVRLACGYYDLIEFLKKIEMGNQLMKVTDLNIKGGTTSGWEHDIEFSISAFSKGVENE